MASLYGLYSNVTLFTTIIIVLSIWSLVWKGLALWRAARKKSKGWFVILLIINSAGLLPILYLLFSKKPRKTREDFGSLKDRKKEVAISPKDEVSRIKIARNTKLPSKESKPKKESPSDSNKSIK